MLSAREWLTNELHVSGRTALDFFTTAWDTIYRRPCRSNQIELDVKHWITAGVVPTYIFSLHERLTEEVRAESKSTAYHYFRVEGNLILVSEPSTILMAHKDKRGVWVC